MSAGLVLLAMIWGGPLLDAWRDSFAAGMVAHMGVVAVAAPLIAIGLPARWRPGAAMPAALPVLASLVELAAVWGWHAPAMRLVAETSLLGTIAEQASFLVTGVLLWSTSFAAPGERKHALVGAGALLLTSMHMTLLGALLSLSPRPLYGAEEVTCFGTVLGAAQDQQFGGVIMLAVGAMVYLAGGLFLMGRLLSSPSYLPAHKTDSGSASAATQFGNPRSLRLDPGALDFHQETREQSRSEHRAGRRRWS